jgi:lysophospholipase L1-like esterase
MNGISPHWRGALLPQCAPTYYGPAPSARVKGENLMRSRQPALAHQTGSDHLSGQPRLRPVWKMLFITSVAINLVGILGLGCVIYKNKSYIKNWYSRNIKDTSHESRWHQRKREAYRQKAMIFSASNEILIYRPIVIFVGDSLANGFPWNEWLVEETSAVIVDRAIDGEILDRLVDRFESTFPPNPHIQKIFIMIGISDILTGEFQINTFIDKYQTLLEKLLSITSPDNICIVSILPARRESISNVIIQNVNESLKSLSYSQGVCYLDLYSIFTDLTGQLDQNLTYDGLHLTVEGYKSWLAAIKAHIPTKIH